jgi:hypothetical protein
MKSYTSLLLAFATVLSLSGAGCTRDNSGATDDLGTDDMGTDDGSTADLAMCVGPTQSCYSGPAATAGVGVCQAGTQTCSGGVAGACIGEIDPSAESCNGLDDDCNGTVDDGLGMVSCGIGACKNTVNACNAGKPAVCTPKAAAPSEICGNGIDDDCNGLIDDGCCDVYVAPTGNDTNPGTAILPKLTIVAAIAAAGTGPKLVCVAAAAACPTPTTQVYPEAVDMQNGVSVIGGYESTTWTRNANCVTQISDQNDTGVHFGASVTTNTQLGGFTVAGKQDPTSAAVTVEGSIGAIIADDTITGAGTTTSYGVNVIDASGSPAKPQILRSGITGGNGTMLSIGVHSLNSAPTVQLNCDTIDAATGRCTSNPCFPGVGVTQVRFIRGRGPAGNGAETYGVRLESSPNAVIEENAICANGASADEAALRLSGNGTGVQVDLNYLFASGASMNAVGFWADPCAAASPLLLNNTQVSGNSSLMGGRADGVRAIGDCHVRVDSNVLIIGGVETANADANGVYCARDAQTGVASRCTVLGNTEIRGSGGGFPPTSTGVHCEAGACARIEKNALITAHGGILTYGVRLTATGTFVNANNIEAGCATKEGTGILTEAAFARIQNNAITGSICATANTANSQAVRVLVSAGTNEVDLHSNDLFGAGSNLACTSRALAFDVVPGAVPPAGPAGIVRNNILFAGACQTRYDIEEQSISADPRLVENNDFWAANGAPTALYRDEAANDLTMLSAVNGLTAGPAAAANLSADPMFTNGLHLPANSPCVNVGTATGAPATDFEGDARPQQGAFDVGYDEYKP